VCAVYRCTRRERKALLFTRPRQARQPPSGSNRTPVQESASMSRGPILGIEVSDATLARWVEWFAPDPQPFLVEGGEHVPVSEELRDTFGLYDLTRRRVSVRWIREVEYFAMTRSERSALLRDQVRLGRALVPTVASIGPDLRRSAREQADGRRFVWWPSLLSPRNRREILGRFVTGNRARSRHAEVPTSVWRAVETQLPAACRVGGVFPLRSGPNCFGTVMSAAGHPGSDDDWVQREPFEQWLANAARGTSRRNADAAGVVMVWRDVCGQAEHAAVTLGSGWALHKPSQGWMSPSMVLRTAELVRSVRMNGLRMQRYLLHDPA
jgi:hypothetical protein